MVAMLALLLALGFASTAAAAPAGDRRERFTELARRYAEAPDPEGSRALLAELFAVVDAEIIENLDAGGPFASAAFIQERLDALSEAWGGAAFRVLPPERGGKDTLTLALHTVTRGEPRGSLRIYGRSRGDVALLAAVTHDGAPEVHAWPPRRDGASQLLTSWLGAPTGRGSRPLHLELWRLGGQDAAARLWSSDETFPEGLWVTGFTVKSGELRIRYEVHYPGWKPGCEAETEQEDVYRQASPGTKLVLGRRQVLNGWHRELHATVSRFFGALGAGDRETLAELVPDASLRARLPRELRPEAACDERDPDIPGTVSVAATGHRDHRPAPWSLSWRRGPRGWRLAAAAPVLQ